MAVRFQNDSHLTGQPPSYYANNKLYKDSYTRTDWQSRTSRRIHDGLSLTMNFGLDTVSDDINSSPYSSPYYVNGRYTSDNLTTQRGNSASVQGTKFMLSINDEVCDFSNNDIQTYIELHQGKQIKFELPYSGMIVGNTITVKNTKACTGILSIYISDKENGLPIYETALDLCKVSTDKFEHFTLRAMTPVKANANPRGKIYVRMEIWDEISMNKDENPFNTGRYIEIASTGLDNHYAAEIEIGDKNVPANSESYDYKRLPSRPLIGLIYNNYESIPVDRIGNEKTGATVSHKGYRYDIFCIKDAVHAEVVIYDREMNSVVEGTNIKVDGRADQLFIAQVVERQTENNWVYYVDGYSNLQKFKIGEWISSQVVTGDESTEPVDSPKLIIFHNNRLYIGGFAADPNLWQCTDIDENGPNYNSFPYRFYTPDDSPYATSVNNPNAVIEYSSDSIIILGDNFYSIFTTNADYETDTKYAPTQVSGFTDAIGVQSQGDVTNYKGVVYSFDPKEGIRYFTGGLWKKVSSAGSISSYFDRVDMTRRRKIWGFRNKLYFNYTDKVDGKDKCLVWDMSLNYQQYPWFQDIDVPFCDVRYDESEQLIGIHPDYPCIMELYAEDTWRRMDTPIVFERHTKFISIPGNANDAIIKRIHNKVLANSNRWWYFGIATDKQNLGQTRGRDTWYRMPCWDTINEEDPVESPFNYQDLYEENATIRLTISNLRIRCSSIQCKIKTKTFRDQASLISTLFESGVRQYN